jgi:hypothetical protein
MLKARPKGSRDRERLQLPVRWRRHMPAESLAVYFFPGSQGSFYRDLKIFRIAQLAPTRIGVGRVQELIWHKRVKSSTVYSCRGTGTDRDRHKYKLTIAHNSHKRFCSVDCYLGVSVLLTCPAVPIAAALALSAAGCSAETRPSRLLALDGMPS